jgi:hypothetical protein
VGVDRRYSKAADWEYIAECAALIKRAKEEMAEVTDSSYQNLEYGTTQQMAFIGYTSHVWVLTGRNGDVNSYIDFYTKSLVQIPPWLHQDAPANIIPHIARFSTVPLYRLHLIDELKHHLYTSDIEIIFSKLVNLPLLALTVWSRSASYPYAEMPSVGKPSPWQTVLWDLQRIDRYSGITPLFIR